MEARRSRRTRLRLGSGFGIGNRRAEGDADEEQGQLLLEVLRRPELYVGGDMKGVSQKETSK